MKNLLIITSRYPHKHDSISGVFVKSQVDELRKHFEKVVVISTTPYVPKFITKLTKPKRKKDALAKDYSYDNVDVYFTKEIVPPISKLKENRGMQAYRKVNGLLRKTGFKPDIIHAHFTWPSGFAAMKIGEKLNTPYIITGHAYDIYDLPFRNRTYNTIIKKILNNSSHIITVSKNNKRILTEKLDVLENNITIIPNGYSQELFFPMDKQKAKEKVNISTDKKFILTIGNSQYLDTKEGRVEVKGHKYLYQAAKLILEKHQMKNVVFGIVGDVADNEIKIEENMKDNFILFGKKPHSEIPLWMNACDIFVMPSLHEGVPTVLFEALGCGKPLVGTEVGGIPDIIENENLGILVQPSDAEALSTAILEALNKDWNHDLIMTTAISYRWENVSKSIYQVYENIVMNTTKDINLIIHGKPQHRRGKNNVES